MKKGNRFVIIIVLVLFLSGFLIPLLIWFSPLFNSYMTKEAISWRIFGKDIGKVRHMNLTDIDAKIDYRIDVETIKNNQHLSRGKFVKLKGKVSDVGLAGAFAMGKSGKTSPDKVGFVLDGKIVVWCLLKEFSWLKDGDVVEIVGMVSHTSIFKYLKEGRNDTNIPDYEVVVAKIVKKV